MGKTSSWPHSPAPQHAQLPQNSLSRRFGHAERSVLREVLGQAQERGWIGPQAIDRQVDHSLGFAGAAAAEPTVAVDLGSGGGLPALVLVAIWPKTRWVLVESSLPRAAFLELHCARLGWSERVDVVHLSAERLAERGRYREAANLVTARSFGPWASVVKAAAPLLCPGGELIVSAAPDAAPWPADFLSVHGFSSDRLTQSPPCFHRATQRGSIL